MREAVRTEGDVMRLPRLARKTRQRPVLLLIDVLPFSHHRSVLMKESGGRCSIVMMLYLSTLLTIIVEVIKDTCRHSMFEGSLVTNLS